MASAAAEDLAKLLGASLAQVRGPDAAKALPAFRALAERIVELPADGEWGALVRGMVHDGGFAAAYAANRFAEARDFADAACETYRSQPDMEASYARSLNNRGLTHMELGDLVKAEEDFRAALAMITRPTVRAKSLNADSLIRTVQDHLGIIAEMRRPGEIQTETPANATESHDLSPVRIPSFMSPALRLVQSTNNARVKATNARRSGRIDDARRILQTTVDEARTVGEPRPLGIALSNLGELLLESDPSAALAILSESVEVLEQLPAPNESLALAQHNLSIALENTGEFTRATDAAKRAWLLIQEASPSGPAALTILQNLAKLRLFQHDSTRARAILQHAMSLYEGARSRFAVLEPDHAGPFVVYRSLVELMLLIAVNDQWIDDAVTLIENAKGRFLSEYLERLEQSKVSARAGTSGLLRECSDERSAETEVDFSSQLAASGILVISFFTGPNMTFATWSAGTSGGVYRIDIQETELRERVETFYSDLQSASRAQPWRNSGRDLRGLLFDKIADQLAGSETILVLPDGPLWLLPFDALMLSAKAANETPDEAAVYSAFSLRSIGQLRNLAPARRPQRRHAVIVAKSEFQNQANLKSTIGEVKAIAAHLEQAGFATTILQGAQATGPNVLRAMGDAEIVHIATHAVAPADGTDPYIVIDDGSGGDATLTLKDIIALRLPARLVFLSVCSSGAGSASVGEGIVSIARAFILTGCQGVIASLWPVVTEDAATLAERFYEAYTRVDSPAEALRIAKRGWHDGGPFMRTAAAFQIYGDGDARYTVNDLVASIRKRNSP
ncbi:MAG TPA: CHAT domain-containing protein [Xanthobacteraceae bacterium]|nr:CHAT domain-containing protein [Xanthobacteraceae bacterium]